MKFLISFLIILSAFPTCCNDNSVEIEKVALSNEQVKLIPYSLNQKINFRHSNGFIFDFLVSEDYYDWISDSYCDECCGGEYTSYQKRVVSLKSEYPEFNISLSLDNQYYFDVNERFIDLRVNRYQSNIRYDSNFEFICDNITCFNEVIINDKTYFNVIETELENYYSSNNSITLYPKTILYNKDFGIIQIKMSNNETFSLNI